MPTSFLTKAAKTYDGEKTVSSTNVAGKVFIGLQKNETRSVYHSVLVSTLNGSGTLISDLK
jgi:hypothetical protein